MNIAEVKNVQDVAAFIRHALNKEAMTVLTQPGRLYFVTENENIVQYSFGKGLGQKFYYSAGSFLGKHAQLLNIDFTEDAIFVSFPNDANTEAAKLNHLCHALSMLRHVHEHFDGVVKEKCPAANQKIRLEQELRSKSLAFKAVFGSEGMLKRYLKGLADLGMSFSAVSKPYEDNVVADIKAVDFASAKMMRELFNCAAELNTYQKSLGR